jgi:hypothetical protein
MLKRVKIKSLPKAKDGGVSYNQLAPMYMPNNMNLQPTKVKDSLTAVPRDQANLEAEGGETALVPNVNGLPAHYKITGNRHTQGGVPLNLPDQSFIFSDTRAMIIKDPKVLAEFNETKPKTPAQIAKKYDINKYREILENPDMDQRSKDTAELMISNYNIKLGKLAAYQEAMKGFTDGIPTVAMPYLANNGINPQDMLPLKPAESQGAQQLQDQMYAEQNPDEEQFESEQEIPEAQFGGGRIGQRLRNLFRQNRQFDPRTGIYMNTDNQGRVFYVDGRGVPLPANIQLPQEFMPNGTVIQNGTMTAGPTTKTTTTTTRRTVTESKSTKAKIDESKIKKKDDPSLKEGDYFRDAEGKLRRVTKTGYSKKPVGTTYSGKEDYKPAYGSIEEDVKKANEILAGLKGDAKNPGYVSGDGENGWTIYAGAADKLSIKDKDFLTKVMSYNKSSDVKNIGAPGLKVSRQSQYVDSSEKEKRKNGFYGFASPEMLEFRYWQATHPEGSPEDFDKIDDAAKVQNRKGMLTLYGYDVKKLGDKVNDPTKLYTEEFVTNPETGLTARNEITFKGKDAKTYRSADDAKIGLDHLDAYTLAPEYGDELIDETTDIDENTDIQTNEIEIPQQDSEDAPYWKQDVVKTLGAFGDLNRVKKYTPWAPKVSPYVPDPTFYDPTRELANITEQMAIGAEGAAAYAPAQAYNARMSGMQGQGAKAAADVLGRYNNLNVGASNQFELTKANIFNQANATNAAQAQNLYDQMTIANQQYDNSKNQARQELRSSYIDAITNRAQAQALNTAYGDHFRVDPVNGGFVTFTGKTADIQPNESGMNSNIKTFRSLKDAYPEIEDDTLIKLMNGTNSRTDNFANDYMKALSGMYPTQPRGGYNPYYSGE